MRTDSLLAHYPVRIREVTIGPEGVSKTTGGPVFIVQAQGGFE